MQRTAFCDDLSRNLSGFQHGKLRPSIFAAIAAKSMRQQPHHSFRAPCAPDGGWLPGAPVCRLLAPPAIEMPSRQAGTGFQQVFPFDQAFFMCCHVNTN
jgi:hypothetical protein